MDQNDRFRGFDLDWYEAGRGPAPVLRGEDGVSVIERAIPGDRIFRQYPETRWRWACPCGHGGEIVARGPSLASQRALDAHPMARGLPVMPDGGRCYQMSRMQETPAPHSAW